MKHLASLGVDISKASMCWIRNTDRCESEGQEYILSIHDEWCYELSCLDPVPAFTLQDIINLLPSPISHMSVSYFLSIRKNDYGCMVAYHTAGHGNIILSKSKNVLDSAYEVLLWVIENKHLKV